MASLNESKNTELLSVERSAPSGWSALVLIAFLLAALLGCKSVKEKIFEKAAEKAAEQAAEQAGGGEVDIDKQRQRVTIKGDGGDFELGTGASLPDDWPKNVPIYPGSRTVASSASGQGLFVSLIADKPAIEVVSFYKKEFSSFKQTGSMSFGKAETLIYQAPDGMVISLSVAGDTEQRSTIQLAVKRGTKPGNP